MPSRSAPSGLRAPLTSRKLPLVDRQREMPVLDAVLVPAKMGFGSFVELVGPAGIGKSRIVEEICDRAGGLPVVATACEQYESTTPYFPFNRLLRSSSRRAERRRRTQLDRAQRHDRGHLARARAMGAAPR